MILGMCDVLSDTEGKEKNLFFRDKAYHPFRFLNIFKHTISKNKQLNNTHKDIFIGRNEIIQSLIEPYYKFYAVRYSAVMICFKHKFGEEHRRVEVIQRTKFVTILADVAYFRDPIILVRRI